MIRVHNLFSRASCFTCKGHDQCQDQYFRRNLSRRARATSAMCGEGRRTWGSSAKQGKSIVVSVRGRNNTRTNARACLFSRDFSVQCSERNVIRNGSAGDTADNSDLSTSTNEGQSEQSHLDLLQQITSKSIPRSTSGKTISEQLTGLNLGEDEEMTVSLGTGQVEMEPLTLSQRRNIRRQDYLNRVAGRNDTRFFTTVALFIFLPPAVILGVAVATGYINLIP